MTKKKKQTNSLISNKRARFDYDLNQDFTAGLVLTGKETKSLRQGRAHLRGAFIVIKDGELWLTNATIASGQTFDIPEQEQLRSRKLLVGKKELKTLVAAKQQGLSIVPLHFLTNARYIKLKFAVGKGKKRYDKRETIKKRDQLRDAQRTVK